MGRKGTPDELGIALFAFCWKVSHPQVGYCIDGVKTGKLIGKTGFNLLKW